MKLTKKNRQRIIDDYLAQTGQNMFVPAAFVSWLEDQPDHEAYEWFFGSGDAAAAHEHRVWLARRMASGLRISVATSDAEATVVSVKVSEYPAYLSPVEGRAAGGGYVRFDPDDPEAVAELQRQGRTALRAWLSRYGGAFAAEDLVGVTMLAHADQESDQAEGA